MSLCIVICGEAKSLEYRCTEEQNHIFILSSVPTVESGIVGLLAYGSTLLPQQASSFCSSICCDLVIGHKARPRCSLTASKPSPIHASKTYPSFKGAVSAEHPLCSTSAPSQRSSCRSTPGRWRWAPSPVGSGAAPAARTSCPPFPPWRFPSLGLVPASWVKESIRLEAALLFWAVFQPGRFPGRSRCLTKAAVRADRVAQQERTDRWGRSASNYLLLDATVCRGVVLW